MINKWPKEAKRVNTHYSKFSVIDLTENDMQGELKDLKKFLTNRILIHLSSIERLRDMYKDNTLDFTGLR